MVELSINNGIASINLNRPSDANAIDLETARQLASAAYECELRSDVRAVVLTGKGKFFCAGGDVRAMHAYGDAVGSQVKLLVESFHQAISSFARMRAPLINAINGPAAGAGFSLAAAGDLVVAADDATFTLSNSAVGLSPDGSSTFYLPRLIGLRRTQELMFTNRRLTAPEALDWGLITKVVARDQLMNTAHTWAADLASCAPESNHQIKALLLPTFGNDLEVQMALETRAIVECVASPDGKEGISAFLEKRRPRFSENLIAPR